jgi:tetratricopeptide (TPR) repeat protein
LHWNLAQLWDVCDDVAKAEQEWRAVIELWPHAWIPYLNLGRLCENRGREAEAVSLYAESLRINPEFSEGRYAIGVLLTRIGKPAEAIRHFEILVRQKPASLEARLALAQELERANRTREARRQFQELLRLDPSNQAARKALGQQVR